MSQLTDILRSEKFREFIRFAIVGVLATAIHYGLYLLLVRLFRLSETDTLYTNIAYSVGYLVAWCCNFWLSAHFTFRSNTSVKRGIGFAISPGINYLLHLLFLNLFLWMGLSEAVAPIPVFCIVKLLGFKTAEVYYDHKERFAGESKYPLSKMLNFAVDGITSFSIQPLRLITTFGFIVTLLSIVAAIYALVSYLCGTTVVGWTSMLISIWFIGGAILLLLGIIGEYIGKIYRETKRRPRYHIEKTI